MLRTGSSLTVRGSWALAKGRTPLTSTLPSHPIYPPASQPVDAQLAAAPAPHVAPLCRALVQDWKLPYSLEILNCSYNDFQGPLPSGEVKLPDNLHRIYFNNNPRLGGTIPST